MQKDKKICKKTQKEQNMQKEQQNQLKACRGQIDKSEVKLEVSSI